jgi:hypothetical protein
VPLQWQIFKLGQNKRTEFIPQKKGEESRPVEQVQVAGG